MRTIHRTNCRRKTQLRNPSAKLLKELRDRAVKRLRQKRTRK